MASPGGYLPLAPRVSTVRYPISADLRLRFHGSERTALTCHNDHRRQGRAAIGGTVRPSAFGCLDIDHRRLHDLHKGLAPLN
jgi:hypothetical protein